MGLSRERNVDWVVQRSLKDIVVELVQSVDLWVAQELVEF